MATEIRYKHCHKHAFNACTARLDDESLLLVQWVDKPALGAGKPLGGNAAGHWWVDKNYFPAPNYRVFLLKIDRCLVDLEFSAVNVEHNTLPTTLHQQTLRKLERSPRV